MTGAAKAISLPVGDHSGSVSRKGKLGPTTTVLPLPSAFITKIWAWFLAISRTNAMRPCAD